MRLASLPSAGVTIQIEQQHIYIALRLLTTISAPKIARITNPSNI